MEAELEGNVNITSGKWSDDDDDDDGVLPPSHFFKPDRDTWGRSVARDPPRFQNLPRASNLEVWLIWLQIKSLEMYTNM